MQTIVRSESFDMSIIKQLKSIISRVVLDMQLESLYLDSIYLYLIQWPKFHCKLYMTQIQT